MSNDIKLQEGHPVDENLRPLKVGGESSSLSIAKHQKGAAISGDLDVQGDIRQDKFHLLGSDSFLFKDASVGFEPFIATYNSTTTNVYFTNTNKAMVTFGSGNITSVALWFPAVSGNFILLLKHDGTGSRTITNYKVMASDGATAGGSITAKFAGGSNPTLTTDANHVDIISFYWDATNEIAYGVPTLDFQF